jgi:hypothetical protein
MAASVIGAGVHCLQAIRANFLERRGSYIAQNKRDVDDGENELHHERRGLCHDDQYSVVCRSFSSFNNSMLNVGITVTDMWKVFECSVW